MIKSLNIYNFYEISKFKYTGVKNNYILPIYFIGGKKIHCNNDNEFIKILKLKSFI